MRIVATLALALALTGMACEDSASDLLGSPSRESSANQAGPTSGNLGAGDDDDGTTSPNGPSTTADAGSAGDGGSPARALFEALLPTFESTCGPCHVDGTSNAPAYLGGADPYATIKTYPGFIVADPQQSVLLTKGAHEGPAMPAGLEASIVQWLTAEPVAAATGPVETAPITVAIGSNTVDLSILGVPGVSLTFSAGVSGDILTLSTLQISAPATTGIQIAYPIFYINAPGGVQTEDDDLSNDSQTLGAATSAPLDTGLLLVTGWASGDTLQIAFTQMVKATVADAGLAGGCKDVASFTANAVPAIQANTCLNCHNTGGSGNASLDLSGLAATPQNDTAACAQALTRINTTTPAQSDIILAPTGGVTNHPFQGASASFVTMMETWIEAEK